MDPEVKVPEEGAEEQPQGGKDKPVTQEAIDRIYKEMRTTKEQLDRSEGDKASLVARLTELEAQRVGAGGAPVVIDEDTPLGERYHPGNFPQTKEEWDDLIAEEPMYGVDLRAQYLAQKAQTENAKESRVATSRETVEKKHPDMFKRTESGEFILDAQGRKQLDDTSAKAKVYVDIVNRDLSIMGSSTWPELAMEAMENRLSGKKEEEVVKQIEEEKKAAEAKRLKDVEAGAVASGGAEPPADKPKVEVKFNSDEERRHAESLVGTGKIKSLEDYCAVRDNQVVGYGRGGF